MLIQQLDNCIDLVFTSFPWTTLHSKGHDSFTSHALVILVGNIFHISLPLVTNTK